MYFASVLDRDARRCRYCGSSEGLTIDHVVPVAANGDDSADNLVVACKTCNSRKGGRTPEQAGMKLMPLEGDA
jgi:5-methylcytosine-specific restriction endonuclease McrA